MDTIQTITDKLNKLNLLKHFLEKEIDDFIKEIDQVESNTFGVMNRVKALIARQVVHNGGMNSFMTEVYSHAKNREFKNAQDYIDYLRQSIDATRGYISKVDQIYANLEKCQRDLSYKLEETKTWVIKADEIIK